MCGRIGLTVVLAVLYRSEDDDFNVGVVDSETIESGYWGWLVVDAISRCRQCRQSRYRIMKEDSDSVRKVAAKDSTGRMPCFKRRLQSESTINKAHK
jgi:hypothetical protein